MLELRRELGKTSTKKYAALEDVVRIMSQVPEWAPGLPLNADGCTNPFFKKD